MNWVIPLIVLVTIAALALAVGVPVLPVAVCFVAGLVILIALDRVDR